MMNNFIVRELNFRNAESISSHLKRLNQMDRRMRFFSAIADDGIDRYVQKIDWSNDHCFGVFHKTKLIAFAHLSQIDKDKTEKELGISIDEEYRSKGIGKKIFDRVLTLCKAIGVKKLKMECLSSNEPMKMVAEKCGVLKFTEDSTIQTEIEIDTNLYEHWIELNKNTMYEVISLIFK